MPKPRPTPSAPPKTDSVVRSMPTIGSAISSASSISTGLAMRPITAREPWSTPSAAASRASSARDAHSATTAARATVNTPVISCISVRRVLPSGNAMPSSVSTSTGSRSSTCSATSAQITIEMVRSKVATQRAAAKVCRRISTSVRITASDSISAIATDSRLTGTKRPSAARATSSSSSAASGQTTRCAQSIAKPARPPAASRPSTARETPNAASRHAATTAAAHQPAGVDSSAISRLTSGPSSLRSKVKPVASIGQG